MSHDVPEPPAGLSDRSVSARPGLVADCRAASGGAEADLDLAAGLLRVRDRLERVRASIDVKGLTTTGSVGQERGWAVRVGEDGRLERGK